MGWRGHHLIASLHFSVLQLVLKSQTKINCLTSTWFHDEEHLSLLDSNHPLLLGIWSVVLVAKVDALLTSGSASFNSCASACGEQNGPFSIKKSGPVSHLDFSVSYFAVRPRDASSAGFLLVSTYSHFSVRMLVTTIFKISRWQYASHVNSIIT